MPDEPGSGVASWRDSFRLPAGFVPEPEPLSAPLAPPPRSAPAPEPQPPSTPEPRPERPAEPHPSGRPYVHLHTHSSHSLLDSIAAVDALVDAAAADGQPALAITDHGSLAAIWQLTAAAEAAGIKAIPGEELYLAFGSRHEHNEGVGAGDEGGAKTLHNQHLTVLASDPTGWANLMAISAAAHEPEAYWHKPRVDLDLLSEHSEGLVILTGCLSGPLAGPLAAGDRPRAEANLAALVELAGAANVYVEVMSHGIATEQRILPELVGLARRFGLQVVATNDAHYVTAGEAKAHDAWLCEGTKSTISDPNRYRFHGSGYHLRTAAEMRAIFDGQPGTEGACDATLEIAERVSGRVVPPPGRYLPRYHPLPDGETSESLLYRLVAEGAAERYGTPLSPAVRSRLRHEYEVICSKGFADYFLVVSDMISWTHSQGIRTGPSRGSAGGSAVAYCLGVTRVDPLPHGLLFERFLDPGRAGYPDIDTDFEALARDRVIDYLRQRWGAANVARLGSVNTNASRAALLAAGRVLGEQTNARHLADAVPLGAGDNPLPFAVLLDPGRAEGAAFRRLAADEAAGEVAAVAVTFEGVPSSVGQTSGVVVADAPLTHVVPLRVDRGTGRAVTEWSGAEVEEAGLLKLDILGLRNLDIISTASQLIEQTTGEIVDVDDLPQTGERADAAWRLISEGRTAGVFQLEKPGMRQLCTMIRPSNLGDLAVLIALYRPGPLGAGMHTIYSARRSGDEPVDYGIFTDDPKEQSVIAEVLGETFGVPVYQEQLMRLAADVAGWGPSDCYRLIKAVSKKKADEMKTLGSKFVESSLSAENYDGAPKVAFALATAEKLWDAFKSAGDYAFNKSHSVGYGMIAYQTAFLKANWPAAYGAALLAHTDKDEQRFSLLTSLREEGIIVLGPDINRSLPHTTVENGAVRLGLSEIKGAGKACAAIVDERDANGPFSTIADLVARPRPGRRLASNIVVALVEAGAADELGTRKGQVELAGRLRKEPEAVAGTDEWDAEERAWRERRRLGILVSPSPLLEMADELSTWTAPEGSGKLRRVDRLPRPGHRCWVIGIVTRWDVPRKGRRPTQVTIEGTHGGCEGIVWGDTLSRLERAGATPEVGRVWALSGRTQRALRDPETVELVVDGAWRGAAGEDQDWVVDL